MGPLTVEYEVLTPLQDPDQRLVIYRAADAVSQSALGAIAHEVAAATAPTDDSLVAASPSPA